MTGSLGPSVPATSSVARVDRSRPWRVAALVIASVSAVVLFTGGTAGPLLLASFAMLVAVGHLMVARPWQRPNDDRDEEG